MAKLSLSYALKGVFHEDNYTLEEIDKDNNSKFYDLKQILKVFDNKQVSFTFKEDSEIAPIRD